MRVDKTTTICASAFVIFMAGATANLTGEPLPGFRRSAWFDEQLREDVLPCGVRMVFNAPGDFQRERPTRLVFYATPNGNSIEHTLGRATTKDDDWHFDIQHIAAQTRRLREVDHRENIVLVVLEADTRSWPAWRAKHADNATLIRGIVEDAKARMPGDVRVALTGHSGGGSFIFGFINSTDAIPDYVDRIAFLDANYGYSDAERHGDKLLAWLRGSEHLVVIAYDDRNITLDGNRVVGPTGGTFRATQRMMERFSKQLHLRASMAGEFGVVGDGGVALITHHNPENKILHTALVGEMNGFLHAMTLGTASEKAWGTFGGPRAYAKWISAPAIPSRSENAIGGAEFMKRIADLPREQREAAIIDELTLGNIPDFLRKFKTINVTATTADGKEHTASLEVMPDYLAVGSNDDFVRVPMNPLTAQSIADRFGCMLPTKKMADLVYQQAEVKLDPRPLTVEREAVKTFVQHHRIIEEQRAGKPLGTLVAGIKKDVVVTNRLLERPNRVAIFGWHKLDGVPIQPLTIVHVDWYVDYSHGIRLVKDRMIVDGKPREVREVLRDPRLCVLISDEGPIVKSSY